MHYQNHVILKLILYRFKVQYIFCTLGVILKKMKVHHFLLIMFKKPLEIFLKLEIIILKNIELIMLLGGDNIFKETCEHLYAVLDNLRLLLA